MIGQSPMKTKTLRLVQTIGGKNNKDGKRCEARDSMDPKLRITISGQKIPKKEEERKKEKTIVIIFAVIKYTAFLCYSFEIDNLT
jgi:hypothetical protein